MTISSPNTARTFREICNKNNFIISDDAFTLLEKYVELLLEHNKRVNLISRKDEANIWSHHILHCTSLLFKKQFHPDTQLLDLGTGGGLPGIVYSILMPTNRFTLLDSTKKKMAVVQSIVSALNLSNVDVVWGRAEETGRKVEFAHKFDYVVARAVSSLDDLIKWSKPLVKLERNNSSENNSYITKGSLIAFKGGGIENELRKVAGLKFVKIYETIDLQFDGDEILENKDRKVVVVKFV